MLCLRVQSQLQLIFFGLWSHGEILFIAFLCLIFYSILFFLYLNHGVSSNEKQTGILPACLLNRALVTCHCSRSETSVDSCFSNLYRTYRMSLCFSSVVYASGHMNKQLTERFHRGFLCIRTPRLSDILLKKQFQILFKLLLNISYYSICLGWIFYYLAHKKHNNMSWI